MKVTNESMRLYAITDRSWLNGRPFVPQVEEVLAAGATFLQLREKTLDSAAFLAEARELKDLAARYRVPFVVNDSVEIAMEIGADGVHVGQSDIKGRDLRALLGPDKILGVSANTVETAVRAEQNGADYIGVGAVFGTTTKKDAQNITVDQLLEIRRAVSIPIVAIGGINESNIEQLAGSGIDGVAVISAIFASPDPVRATRTLRALSDQLFAGDRR